MIKEKTKKVSRTIEPVFYGFRVIHKNSFELVQNALTIYSTIENLKMNRGVKDGSNSRYLRNRLVEALTFYVLKGYSSETKKKIKKGLKISTQNLNQINAELTSKGYLTKDKYNTRVKHLSVDLEALRTYLLEGEYPHSPMMLIKFVDGNKGK